MSGGGDEAVVKGGQTLVGVVQTRFGGDADGSSGGGLDVEGVLHDQDEDRHGLS